MSLQYLTSFLNRVIAPLMRVITFICGSGLIFMMTLVACDVILRFFNRPIPGAYELVEYAMALTVSFGVTVCAHHQGHITVDILTNSLREPTQKVLACFMTIIAIIYILPIMWQTTLQIGEMYNSHMTSAVLLISVYPFTAIVAFSFAITTLVFIVDFFNLLTEIVLRWTR